MHTCCMNPNIKHVTNVNYSLPVVWELIACVFTGNICIRKRPQRHQTIGSGWKTGMTTNLAKTNTVVQWPSSLHITMVLLFCTVQVNDKILTFVNRPHKVATETYLKICFISRPIYELRCDNCKKMNLEYKNRKYQIKQKTQKGVGPAD